MQLMPLKITYIPDKGESKAKEKANCSLQTFLKVSKYRTEENSEGGGRFLYHSLIWYEKTICIRNNN